ncbi:class I SAM-dependent methyltransferase [Planomicrobium sp. CPCC 101110]|uniref:class I SAM-dependent DNA methyltransferase n=1 Tax=Planomicrobium sp. CPCC 101110 TaxID=2599619 RepID=UPI0011B36609|nr:methyltransferase domain-containing protein [Planomicrobium sp. CPCC 101110]TWT27581.1 methyltransferase domain-containing protein [Planomicrobium sp. CPCC 101110]
MGLEFVEIFDDWVHTYDDSVSGKDKEYRDVFLKYDEILQAVADAASGPVVEFGVGTGNLTEKLRASGLEVIGVEPNNAMRTVTAEKMPDVAILDGDFLNFTIEVEPETFVSTYAFHHLTDEEKAEAFKLYAEKLPAGGKVVFADTVFKSVEAQQEIIEFEKTRGHVNLVEDLNREYYTTLPVMKSLIEAAGFTVEFTQLNKYVWLIDATKKSGNGR